MFDSGAGQVHCGAPRLLEPGAGPAGESMAATLTSTLSPHLEILGATGTAFPVLYAPERHTREN